MSSSSFGYQMSLDKTEFGKVNKHGCNMSVQGGDYQVISPGGKWQSPLVSDGQKVRIKAGGNVNDTIDGSGIRSIQISGIDVQGRVAVELVETNGADATSFTETTWLRISRVRSFAIGAYNLIESIPTGDDLVVEDTTGAEWGRIVNSDITRSMSTIPCLGTPQDLTTLMIGSIEITVGSSMPADVCLFHRNNIDQTSAPFSPIEILEEWIGCTNNKPLRIDSSIGPFPPLSEIGFMARSVQMVPVCVQFESVFNPKITNINVVRLPTTTDQEVAQIMQSAQMGETL